MYKIFIRPLEEKDAVISWKWRNDPDVWKFTGSRPNIIVTPEIEIDWIQNVLSKLNSKRFAIIVDKVYVGNIQLTNITELDAEYHIFIGDKSYWGKGIATKATDLLIDYAFTKLKLKLIYLFVKSDNIAAVKVYEKNGFSVKEKIDNSFKMIIKNNGK